MILKIAVDGSGLGLTFLIVGAIIAIVIVMYIGLLLSYLKDRRLKKRRILLAKFKAKYCNTSSAQGF